MDHDCIPVLTSRIERFCQWLAAAYRLCEIHLRLRLSQVGFNVIQIQFFLADNEYILIHKRQLQHNTYGFCLRIDE